MTIPTSRPRHDPGRRRAALAALAVLASLAFPGAGRAEEEKREPGWSETAELSYVVTGGNAETSTLGVKNDLIRAWLDARLEIRAGAVRAQSTTTSRRAVGTRGSFDVDEDQISETTAELYHLSGKYNHEISSRVFWHAGGGWRRNRFAGIENRYTTGGGVGNVWRDDKHMTYRTGYAATLTREEDVADESGAREFAGLNLSSDFRRLFGDATTYENRLDIDENLEETDDLRAEMVNSVAVAINSHVAVKLGLSLQYDNRPAFVEVDLFRTDGTATGEKVLVELDELDTVFTSSMVISF